MEHIETSSVTPTPLFEELDVKKLSNECQQLLQTLPREKSWDGCYFILDRNTLSEKKNYKISFETKLIVKVVRNAAIMDSGNSNY